MWGCREVDDGSHWETLAILGIPTRDYCLHCLHWYLAAWGRNISSRFVADSQMHHYKYINDCFYSSRQHHLSRYLTYISHFNHSVWDKPTSLGMSVPLLTMNCANMLMQNYILPFFWILYPYIRIITSVFLSTEAPFFWSFWPDLAFFWGKPFGVLSNLPICHQIEKNRKAAKMPITGYLSPFLLPFTSLNLY